MALTIPSTLKLAQLKHLAQKCGIPTTGTKPILLSRIHHEVISSSTTSFPKTKPVRILSIDMGIRNLAYCILDVPRKPRTNESPVLQSWHRLAVSQKPTMLDSDTPAAKEAFDPATLSSIAYALLRHRLLPHNPTHILIERQRFRSMGSKHILEWTIRVNMFESILYAILHTLKAEGIWNGSVISVTPGKVGPFWVGDDDCFNDGGFGEVKGGDGEVTDEKGKKGKPRKAKSVKIRNKGAKIDLVQQWLRDGQMVTLGNQEVEDMARAYKEKWDTVPGKKKSVKKLLQREEPIEGKMGKLDDLADCLLQGMAWIRWEDNKSIVLTNGVEALLVEYDKS